MIESKSYNGINIQWPISSLILSGEKTIETRTYPIPQHYVGKEMLLIETPGKKGNFKSRIRGVIKFTRCFKYDNERQFYLDAERHRVTPESEWAWNADKEKWGWEVLVLEVFTDPIPMPKKTGIKYCKDIRLS